MESQSERLRHVEGGDAEGDELDMTVVIAVGAALETLALPLPLPLPLPPFALPWPFPSSLLFPFPLPPPRPPGRALASFSASTNKVQAAVRDTRDCGSHVSVAEASLSAGFQRTSTTLRSSPLRRTMMSTTSLGLDEAFFDMMMGFDGSRER